jgi:YHS domain-containing protein
LTRLIIFLILVYFFSKVLKKLFLKLSQGKSRINTSTLFGNHSTRSVDEMVQDPVCKVYVPKRDALTAVRSGTTYYFCSRECLEKFDADKVGNLNSSEC